MQVSFLITGQIIENGAEISGSISNRGLELFDEIREGSDVGIFFARNEVENTDSGATGVARIEVGDLVVSANWLRVVGTVASASLV